MILWEIILIRMDMISLEGIMTTMESMYQEILDYWMSKRNTWRNRKKEKAKISMKRNSSTLKKNTLMTQIAMSLSLKK